MTIQHLRSSTTNKRPVATGLSAGQLALNTNAASPGIFFTNSNNVLTKVGPLQVGPNAPNSSPAGSSGNAIGEQWLDTSGSTIVLRVWDGSAWQQQNKFTAVTGTAAAPSITFDGDTDTGIFSSGADAVDISTAGTRRFGIASNGDITVFDGNVTLNAQGDLRFADFDSSNWVAFQAPATVAANITWTLPATDGTNGQALSTNGSGTLSWTNVGSGDVTLNGTQTLTNKTLTDPAIIGTILEDVYTISDGAAFEVDPGNGSIQLITLGANRTPKATNFAAGESITLMVDDGTARTLTWTDATWGTGGVKWTGGSAPTLATSGYTVIQFWKVSTQIYGAYVGDVA